MASLDGALHESVDHCLKFAEILYKCTLCTSLPSILTSKESFVCHVKQLHFVGSVAGPTCPSCNLTFNTRQDLDVHVSTSHPNSDLVLRTHDLDSDPRKSDPDPRSDVDLEQGHFSIRSAKTEKSGGRRKKREGIQKRLSGFQEITDSEDESGDDQLLIPSPRDTENNALLCKISKKSEGWKISVKSSPSNHKGGGNDSKDADVPTSEFGKYTQVIRSGIENTYICCLCDWKTTQNIAFQAHCSGVEHNTRLERKNREKGYVSDEGDDEVSLLHNRDKTSSQNNYDIYSLISEKLKPGHEGNPEESPSHKRAERAGTSSDNEECSLKIPEKVLKKESNTSLEGGNSGLDHLDANLDDEDYPMRKCNRCDFTFKTFSQFAKHCIEKHNFLDNSGAPLPQVLSPHLAYSPSGLQVKHSSGATDVLGRGINDVPNHCIRCNAAYSTSEEFIKHCIDSHGYGVPDPQSYTMLEGAKVAKIRKLLPELVVREPYGSLLRDHLLQLISMRLQDATTIDWGPACNRAVREAYPYTLAQRKGMYKKTYFFGIKLIDGVEGTEGCDSSQSYLPLRDFQQDVEKLIQMLPEFVQWTGLPDSCISRDVLLENVSWVINDQDINNWGMQCNRAMRQLFPDVATKRKGKLKTTYYYGALLKVKAGDQVVNFSSSPRGRGRPKNDALRTVEWHPTEENQLVSSPDNLSLKIPTPSASSANCDSSYEGKEKSCLADDSDT
ncbi:uncharacterized protein LOC106180755 [Lingula anatina]|uniref:Uncharacterized protein LOC106180755 n=1 Tax=Lingula anatina TaxID=7574 RepID=A0A1S3KCY8_LINAN|nr:uncharacterized protein LOC106180755 [Lingula anatina]XP_013420313.1 uncharacterized protein LOC106180755 [Lingula anatina]|eukprot:XP_013420312.1 uncharacterized protein LOC106180755 [Lingula anatina]